MSGQDSEVAVLREQEVSVVARLDERTAVVLEPSCAVAVAERITTAVIESGRQGVVVVDRT